jgi:cytochrome c-type biogenesis protein CcmH/NrfG
MATAATVFELVPAGQNMLQTPAGPVRVLPIPWRDPHTVKPEELQKYVSMLERACAEQPYNADIRTCLGMAHAMNYDVYRSIDALEEARRIAPENFFAQLKFSELHYRLRALIRAEEETLKAVNLAGNAWELSLARKQLAEIRRLRREGTQKPAWTKSLSVPAIMLVLMTVIGGILLAWR